jgi:hypothetical protein
LSHSKWQDNTQNKYGNWDTTYIKLVLIWRRPQEHCQLNGFVYIMSTSCTKNFATFTSIQNNCSSQTLWQGLWNTNVFREFTPSCGARWINRNYVLGITVSPCQFACCHYMMLCLVCTVICAQLGLKGPFSFSRTINSHWYVIHFLIPFCEHMFSYAKTTFAFSSAWQEQQLTPFSTLFIIAIKPAVKQAFKPHCYNYLQQNFNKQWTASSLHMASFCEQTEKLFLVLLLHEVCKDLILTANFHHLI